MASNPASRCCTVGYKHSGTPSGENTKVGGIDAYIAKPSAGKTHSQVAILYLSDILGIPHNAKLIADQIAANGYLTLMPDLFNSDQLPPNVTEDFDFVTWIREGTGGKNPHTTKEVDPIVRQCVDYLHNEHGVQKIGAFGYCFGAKYVCRFLKGDGLVDAGYVAHPSFVSEEEVKGIRGPLSIAAAEDDFVFPEEKRHLTEKLLREASCQYQITLYSGVSHGFAVRADLGKRGSKWATEAAFLQAIDFMDSWLLVENS
ncbi:uncharacterized protein A1O5_09531 [Cladophialophora psammophila CBS 110553]|uniref:Dienelactone hydrolase domain-containing protein n=1 Tax=Cladophialophora psammophila CBS 110553 TaxID=1182543 RepID=W9WHY4_9EURO|nr:uncharacterized protein A1O5_09531 [Cladophialophora psammophila CBS 110553]EXJ67518.1 hypothetical protein A1O5_09531 [Cladophialophora psammophila CBS 110553]